MSFMLWAIVLMIAAMGLIVLEAFLPSGGLLSLLAGTALIASIAVAFYESVAMGVLFMAIATVGLPLLAMVMLKWWPHTPIGRLILLKQPDDQDDVLPETEEYRGMKVMIGKQGIARTKMLPSGAVAIDNRIFDAISPGIAIDAGDLIEVIGVDMGHLVVAPLDESELIQPTPAGPEDTKDDPYQRSLKDFGLDDLEEPLNS